MESRTPQGHRAVTARAKFLKSCTGLRAGCTFIRFALRRAVVHSAKSPWHSKYGPGFSNIRTNVPTSTRDWRLQSDLTTHGFNLSHLRSVSCCHAAMRLESGVVFWKFCVRYWNVIAGHALIPHGKAREFNGEKWTTRCITHTIDLIGISLENTVHGTSFDELPALLNELNE